MRFDTKKTVFLSICLLLLLPFASNAFVMNENTLNPDFGRQNISNELQTAVNSFVNVVKTEEIFDTKKTTVPKTEVPKEMPQISIPEGTLNKMINSAKAFIITGMEICYHIVVPVVKAILPDTPLPEIVHYALAASVFTIIMSMFVSIPKLLILAVSMFLIMTR